MVVGAYVEQFMVVVVPPAYHLARGLRQLDGRVSGLAATARLHLRKQPGARDDGVGLEELQGRGSLHFRRNDTDQIILYADAVHRCDLTVLDDEFERTGESLVLLAFPMETNPDRHPVKDKRGLGKERRARDRIEHQFVVEDTAVINFAFPIRNLLRTSSVRDNLETDLLTRHDADLDLALAALEPPDYVLLDLGPHGSLIEQAFQQAGVEFGVIRRIRHDEKAGDIGAAGRHRQMVRPVTVEMMGMMAVPENHDGAVLCPVIPDEKVELGLLLPFRHGYTLQKTVE